MKISIYLFFIKILDAFSVLPVWNFKNTAIDLLPNKATNDEYRYTIHRVYYMD